MRSRSRRSNSLTSSAFALRQRVDVEIDQRAGRCIPPWRSPGRKCASPAAGRAAPAASARRCGMARVVAQNLRHLQPVLVELRGQFDEIARHRRAGEQRISDVRQHAVQRMAELVEQRAGVVEGEQRRLAGGRLSEIADVEDDRPDIADQLFLVAQRGHPGAGMLGAARVVIADEQRDVLAVGVLHVPGARVLVIERHVGGREGQAEQPARGFERSIDDLVELEVGLDLGLVQIELGLAALLGVIAPVPGREREVAALVRDDLLHGVALGQRLGAGAGPDVFQQLARGARRLGHLVVEPVVGKGVVARAAWRARRARRPFP